MSYASPAAFRQALETRLRKEAEDRHVDLQRLRRRAAFERFLVRITNSNQNRWVLKGGMALELRLGDRARVTKDLDVALLDSVVDHEAIRTILIEALTLDPEGDGFEFRIGRGTALSPDEAGRPGVRFPLVEALLAGRTFAQVRVDVVARAEEITSTEQLTRPSLLDFAGKPPITLEVVSPVQHFAEKLHALTREYGEQLSSRVKDLPDLILLIEDGLDPSAELMRTVQRVFQVRGTHPVPEEIPRPPTSWDDDYASFADDLDIEPKTIDGAMSLLQEFWAEALRQQAEV